MVKVSFMSLPPKLSALPDTSIAFCDGACKNNPGKGGFGAVIILPSGEQIDVYGGEIKTTNNRMELMGAIAALQYSPPTLPLQIWTDSGYVKDGITRWITGWKAKGWRKADGKAVVNQELWQQLDAACQQRQVSWHWLKGHAGHEGNEYADTLANLGVDNLPRPLIVKKKPLKTNLAFPTLSQAQPLENIKVNILQTTPNTPMQSPLMTNHNPAPAADHLLPVADSFTDSFFTDDEEEPVDEADEETATFETEFYPKNSLGDALVPPNVIENSTNENFNSNSQIASQNLAPTHHNPFQDSDGNYIAQSDDLISQRPEFDGNTQRPNVFVPLLPLPKHKNASNRQLILDTETTGFDAQGNDRIVEIGIVELINRKFTGEKLHVYINPQRQMDEEVIRIHGITNEFLADKPSFAQIGRATYEFMLGAELVAHNANFDMGFLVAEFNRLGLADFAKQVSVVDSLAIAKQQYAGQRNTLDALVKRLDVGKQDRTFHGALLDAEILAEVYLAMTGGQVTLAIDDAVGGLSGTGEHLRFDMPVARVMADEASQQAHLAWVNALKGEYPALLDTLPHWGLLNLPENLLET